MACIFSESVLNLVSQLQAIIKAKALDAEIDGCLASAPPVGGVKMSDVNRQAMTTLHSVTDCQIYDVIMT